VKELRFFVFVSTEFQCERGRKIKLQKGVDSDNKLCIMRTSSLPRQLLFKRTNKQLTSVGAWFFGDFSTYELLNHFKI
jgi:hypothetical protein